MAQRGQRRTAHAQQIAADLVVRLAPLGDLSARGLFGGYGLYEAHTMFGLVNAAGIFHLRADAETALRFEAAGGTRFGKMPYYSVPPAVLTDPATLQAWAAAALSIAQAALK